MKSYGKTMLTADPDFVIAFLSLSTEGEELL